MKVGTSSKTGVGISSANLCRLSKNAPDLISVCLTDEIVDTLGEGTFGKVVQCLDHSR